MKTFLPLAIAALLSAPALAGDVVITKEKHTDRATVMGQEQPAKDTKEAGKEAADDTKDAANKGAKDVEKKTDDTKK